MPESGVRNKLTLIDVAVRLVGPPRRGGDTADGSIGTVVVLEGGNVVVVVDVVVVVVDVVVVGASSVAAVSVTSGE
jgi:hypothetical protein